MTQIPEVGSVWSQGGHNRCIIVYADEVTVLAEWLNSPGVRFTSNADRFPIVFQPEPRKVTHRWWVNLYADGYVGRWFTTESEAKSCSNGGIVETRLIEWTVEE